VFKYDEQEESAVVFRVVEAQVAEAVELFGALMAEPPEKRMERVRTPPFPSLPLASLLVVESQRCEPGDPPRSEELARLALAIAGLPHPSGQTAVVADVSARACTLIGNARRLLGDVNAADDRFVEALFHLVGTPDSSASAFYFQTLARLRLDAGRVEDGLALLERAADLYALCGDSAEHGHCRAQMGFLHLEQGRAERAEPELERACLALDPHRHRSLWVHARLSLALCHARLGRKPKALLLLDATRPYCAVLANGAGRRSVLWLEGRIAAATDQPGRAAGVLAEVRQSFAASGRVYEAALVTLDLALVAARQGQPQRAHELLADVAVHLPVGSQHQGVVATLIQLGTAIQGGEDPSTAATAAAALLHRLRRSASPHMRECEE
jgi:hypothetical protein